jgi:hypothetical protein
VFSSTGGTLDSGTCRLKAGDCSLEGISNSGVRTFEDGVVCKDRDGLTSSPTCCSEVLLVVCGRRAE